MKVIKAIENLKNLLTPEGKIVVTLPLGYNLDLDKILLPCLLENFKFVQFFFKKILPH